jgi:hypothetical protein
LAAGRWRPGVGGRALAAGRWRPGVGARRGATPRRHGRAGRASSRWPRAPPVHRAGIGQRRQGRLCGGVEGLRRTRSSAVSSTAGGLSRWNCSAVPSATLLCTCTSWLPRRGGLHRAGRPGQNTASASAGAFSALTGHRRGHRGRERPVDDERGDLLEWVVHREGHRMSRGRPRGGAAHQLGRVASEVRHEVCILLPQQPPVSPRRASRPSRRSARAAAPLLAAPPSRGRNRLPLPPPPCAPRPRWPQRLSPRRGQLGRLQGRAVAARARSGGASGRRSPPARLRGRRWGSAAPRMLACGGWRWHTRRQGG